jgi:serine/threonine protein phosphatase PrpC
MVLARCRAGHPVDIAHVGDCCAYGWDGVELHQLTTKHTHGERLRQQGVPEHEAVRHDHKIITSIARATVATVAVTSTSDPVVLLTSDGVKLDQEQLTAILRDHDFAHGDPFLCASAVLAAAEQAGTRDNASVAVIVHPAARRDG